MNLIKKIISLSLTFFMFFGVAHANPSESVCEVKSCGDSTAKKVIGGVSAGIASLGFVACYLYMRNSKLPVLIIGGDKSVRDRLISSIYASDASSNGSVARCLVNKLCLGGNYFFGLDERVASIDNWLISQCDLDDPNAINLASKASAVVAIVDVENSVDGLLNIFEVVPNRYGRAILTIITEDSDLKCDGIQTKEDKRSENYRYKEYDFLTGDYVAQWNYHTGRFCCVRNSSPVFDESTLREVYDYNNRDSPYPPEESYSKVRQSIIDGLWKERKRNNEEWNALVLQRLKK